MTGSRSGRIVPADSQIPITSPRFRAEMPRPATEGLSSITDTREPRFRSALERLAGVDQSAPSAARLNDSQLLSAVTRSDVDDLRARYRASSTSDADLRSALQRISSPLSTGRAAPLLRPGGSDVDYAKGPIRRLSDPNGQALRAAQSDGSLGERLRSAASGGADVSEHLAGANEVGPTRRTISTLESDASLGLGANQFHDDSIIGTGSDFVPQYAAHKHAHYYHHHNYCWYGTSWWYKPWSFGLYLSWPFYHSYFKPIWLSHPYYGTYPWYGGYGFGYCGVSSWYHGSYNSWSWGLSSAWGPTYHSPTTIYIESTPEVVYVESAPKVIYVESEPVVVEEPVDEASQYVAPAAGAAQPANRALGIAADRYLTLGDRAFRDARFADAVHYYSKATALEPEVAVLHLLLSDAHFATGDYTAAARSLRLALIGDPMLVRSEVDKRDFYSEKRAFDRQLAVCELYLAEHPMDDDARLVLAVNLLFSGAPASAVDLLEADLALGLRNDPVARLVLEMARERQYGAAADAVGASNGQPSNN